MKSLFIFMLIVANTVSFFAQELKVDDKTVSYLKQFDSDYEQAMLNSEPGIMSKYLSEDIRLMPEYQKTVMGKPNAVMYQEAFTNRFDILEYSRNKSEMLDLGSRIVEFGIYFMKIKLKTNGDVYDLNGNYGNVWIKQESSDPLLITEAWNYSKHMDCGQYLVFDEVPVVNIAFEAHVPVNNSISFVLAAINKYTEEFITEHNDYLWSQLYGENAKLIYSNHPIYTGKEEINSFLKDHVKHLPVFEKLDIRTDQIDDLGDFVIEYSSHIAIVRNGDWSGVSTGKNMVIWKRHPDCSLKIFRSIAMYD